MLGYISCSEILLFTVLCLVGARFVSTKVHNIDSVVNPRTKNTISVYEAVKEGIIDEETGL